MNKVFKFVLMIIMAIMLLSSCNDTVNNIETVITSETVTDVTALATQVSTEADPKKEFIQQKIEDMTLEEKIGQLFMISIRKDSNDKPVLVSYENVTSVINEYKPGGFILFNENIDTVEQTQKFIYDLQSNSSIPLFIGIDEEGGRVSRLQKSGNIGATKLPTSKVIGDSKDETLAYNIGDILGKELSVLGFNMNFAPVADVYTNKDNTVIGDRAFSSDADIVGTMVTAEIRGIQQNNVSSVIKHFPGHGDTKTDTHYGATYLDSDLERLRQIEFVPFEKAILENPDGIMVSHISLPNITGNNIPASMSKTIVTDILRNEMGYEGLVITDALDMGAITQVYNSGEVAKSAINAGVDILLIPQNINEAYNSLYYAIKNNEISESRIDESIVRILSVKYDRDLFSKNEINKNAVNILGCKEHQDIIDSISNK